MNIECFIEGERNRDENVFVMSKKSTYLLFLCVLFSSLFLTSCGSSSGSGGGPRVQDQNGGDLTGYGFGPGNGTPVPFGPGSSPTPPVDPPLGLLYVTESQSNTLAVYDTKTFALVSRVNVGTDPRGLSFDTERNRVLISRLDGSVLSLDADDLNATPLQVPPVVDPGSLSAFYDAINDAVWIGSLSEFNSIAALNADTLTHLSGSPIVALPSPSPTIEGIGNIIVEPSGQRAYITQSVGAKASLIVVDAVTRAMLYHIDTMDPSGDLNEGADGIAYHPDFGLIFVGNIDYSSTVNDTIAVLDTSSDPPVVIQHLSCGAGPSSLAIDFGRNRLYATNYNASAVQVFSITNSGTPLALLTTLPTTAGPVSVVYDEYFDRIITSNADSDRLSVYDADTLTQIPGSPFVAGDLPNGLYIRQLHVP